MKESEEVTPLTAELLIEHGFKWFEEPEKKGYVLQLDPLTYMIIERSIHDEKGWEVTLMQTNEDLTKPDVIIINRDFFFYEEINFFVSIITGEEPK